jgi:hypothetical protein
VEVERLSYFCVTGLNDRGRAISLVAHEREVDDADGPALVQLGQRRGPVSAEFVSLKEDHGDGDGPYRVRVKNCGHDGTSSNMAD